MHFVNIYSYVFYCEKTIALMHLVRYYEYKFSYTELTVAPVRIDIKTYIFHHNKTTRLRDGSFCI